MYIIALSPFLLRYLLPRWQQERAVVKRSLLRHLDSIKICKYRDIRDGTRAVKIFRGVRLSLNLAHLNMYTDTQARSLSRHGSSRRSLCADSLCKKERPGLSISKKWIANNEANAEAYLHRQADFHRRVDCSIGDTAR